MAIYDFELTTPPTLYNLTLSQVGAQGIAGADGVATFSWMDYVTSFSSDPTLTTVLAGNEEVYTYLYNAGATTAYRHITNTTDKFYSAFDGTIFSGLLANKQQTITV